MDVDPPASGGLPTHLCLADLHYSGQIPVSGEVQVGDCDATASIPLSYVTRLVVGVGYEDVPLVVNHVGVQVVWPAGVVGIIPSVNEGRIGLVGNIDQCDCDLGRITPLPNIRVSSTGIDQLVLHDHVLPVVVD